MNVKTNMISISVCNIIYIYLFAIKLTVKKLLNNYYVYK